MDFCVNNSIKEKKSVEYGLIFREIHDHKGGRIPLTSNVQGLAKSEENRLCRPPTTLSRNQNIQKSKNGPVL